MSAAQTAVARPATAAGNARGVLFIIAAMAIFATQDALSKYLAERYSVLFITMIRYWFFALFVVAVASAREGGIRAAARTSLPWLQAFRGVLLAAEICVMVTAFALLGLVESHAIFASYSLIVAALSGPVLGERVGWRRWVAIAVGFLGVLIILRPGTQVFDPAAPIAVVSALMFALYGLLTRYVGRVDSAGTSFFYTGVFGAAAMTLVGPFFWTPMEGWDWAVMAALCVTGASGHFLLIKALEQAEASAVQPFTYLQLVFASAIGVAVFGERLETALMVGAALVVGAGLFTIWRERAARRRAA